MLCRSTGLHRKSIHCHRGALFFPSPAPARSVPPALPRGWRAGMGILIVALSLLQAEAAAAETGGARSNTARQPLPASDEASAALELESDGLHWVDGIVIGAYVLTVLGLGWYYSRTQTSTEEYFVGNRGMNPLLVGISIFATLFSTISYLSVPGELIEHGPVFLTGILAIPVAYLVVGYLMVPVYMRNRVTSAYELLEAKLGTEARLIGAAMFIALRLLWMSLLIFLASKAMLVMLGLGPSVDIYGTPVPSLLLVTIMTGSVAVIYSSLGGLRAVVITDLFQSLLLFGGAVLVVVTVTVRLGGFEWFPTSWDANWDTQPLFSLNPWVRVTVFGSVLQLTVWWVCTAGGDQTAIQRFMATEDARSARRSFLMNSISGAMVLLMLALVGFALLAYFRENSHLLPEGLSVASNADLLFPRYISHHLPIGLSGLVVSGMFAAAMSSIDSGINSISAVVTTDFVDRFRKRPMTEKTHVRFAQTLAFTVGIIVISASSFMEYVPGNFLEMTKRTHELFVAPLFVLFFMALFVPFATPLGAVSGAAAALATAVFVAYADVWSTTELISFQWILPSSLTAGLLVGCLLSLLPRADGGNDLPIE